MSSANGIKELIADLTDCLENMTQSRIDEDDRSDWVVENEMEVVAARALISMAREYLYGDKR